MTLVMPLAASSVIANEAMTYPRARNVTAPRTTNPTMSGIDPLIWTPNNSAPTPTMMIAWASAMSSRIETFEPTSCQRRSGVAARRLRMSFSRSATNGIAAKIPTCMTDRPSMLGTK